jgi:hypothetical protein
LNVVASVVGFVNRTHLKISSGLSRQVAGNRPHDEANALLHQPFDF